MLRLGVVPFWTVFNDQMSADRLNNYLDTTNPYDEIYMTLFSKGLHSLGIASSDQWRSILNRARQHGEFIGVDKQKYPVDAASYVRHYNRPEETRRALPNSRAANARPTR